MKVAITGASGLLGANLAIALTDEGHAVRATKRASTKIDHLAKVPIEWVEGDLDSTDALAAAFEGCDAVFHCAAQVSILKKATPELVRANVDGTRNVIAAFKRARARRLVHCSSVVAVGLSEDGAPCDERARWNFDEHGMADGYAVTKHMAEEVVRAAASEGLDVAIGNPTYMIGPYDARPSSGELVRGIVQKELPGLVPGLNNFVDVRDVAHGFVSIWKNAKRGERYILGGETMSYGDFAVRVARVVGIEPLRRNVPRAATVLLGWLGDAKEALTGEPAKITSVSARYAFSKAFIFTSAKAERELGYRAGPLDDAIRDCVAWFRERGMLPP